MEESAEIHFSKDDLDLFSGNTEKIKNEEYKPSVWLRGRKRFPW